MAAVANAKAAAITETVAPARWKFAGNGRAANHDQGSNNIRTEPAQPLKSASAGTKCIVLATEDGVGWNKILNVVSFGEVQQIHQRKSDGLFGVIVCVKSLISGQHNQKPRTEFAGQVGCASDVIHSVLKRESKSSREAAGESQTADADPVVTQHFLNGVLAHAEDLLASNGDVSNSSGTECIGLLDQRVNRCRLDRNRQCDSREHR